MKTGKPTTPTNITEQKQDIIETETPLQSSAMTKTVDLDASPLKKLSKAPPRRALTQMRNTTNFTAPFGLMSRLSDNATKPDVNGPAHALHPTPQPNLAKGAKAQAEMQARIGHTVDAILDKQGLSPNEAATSAITAARATNEAADAHIVGLFNPPANDSPGAALGRQLMADFQQAGATPAQARDLAIMTGMALRSVTADATQASQAWASIKAGTNPVDKSDPQSVAAGRRVNDALRAMASTPLSFGALWGIKTANHHADAIPENAESFCTALRTTDKLLSLGANLGPTSAHGVADFERYALLSVGEAPLPGGKTNTPPPQLGSNEGRDVLALQSLLYSTKKMKGQDPSPQQTAAFVAWRNNYTESGPGTAFNQVTQRLHKFTTYILRASSRPQFFSKDVLKAVGNGVKGFVGKNMNPMSAMRYGTLGHEAGILNKAQEKFATSLGNSIALTQAALNEEANKTLANGENPGRMQEVQAQIAVLEHWKTNVGMRKGVKLVESAHADIAGEAAKLTLGITADQLKVAQSRMPKKLTLKLIDQWATTSINNTGGADRNTKLAAVHKEIETARTVAKAQSGNKTSTKPTVDELEATTVAALTTTIGMAYRHTGVVGADALPTLGVKVPWAGVGIAAGPQLRVQQATTAIVRAGSNSAGTEMFVGKETRTSVQGGVVGRASVKLPGLFTAQFSLSGVGGKETARGEAAVIRVPKGAPDQRGKMTQVVGFYFDEARKRANGQNVDPAQMWEGFANKFVDMPEVSVNRQETWAEVKRGGIGVSAGVRVGLGDASIGPVFGAAYDYTKLKDGWNETHGKQKGVLENEGTRHRIVASAQLSGRAPAFTKFGHGLLSEIRAPSAGMGNASIDFELGGMEGQTRLVTDAGKVSHKHSLFYSKFRDDKTHLNALETRRDYWQTGLQHNDGGGQAALDHYRNDTANLPLTGPAGNRFYMDRSKLTEDGAHELDVLNSFQQLNERMGGAAFEGHAIAGEMSQALKSQDANREPEKLTTYELGGHTIGAGVDFLVTLQNRKQVVSTLRNLNDAIPAAAPKAKDTSAPVKKVKLPIANPLKFHEPSQQSAANVKKKQVEDPDEITLDPKYAAVSGHKGPDEIETLDDLDELDDYDPNDFEQVDLDQPQSSTMAQQSQQAQPSQQAQQQPPTNADDDDGWADALIATLQGMKADDFNEE